MDVTPDVYKSWIAPVPRGLSGCQHKFVHIISCWWCSGDSGGTPLIKLTNIPITQKFITDCDGPHRQIAHWAVGLRPKEGLVLGTPYWMPGCHRRPCGRNASDVQYPLAGLRQGTWYFVNLYKLYIYTTFFCRNRVFRRTCTLDHTSLKLSSQEAPNSLSNYWFGPARQLPSYRFNFLGSNNPKAAMSLLQTSLRWTVLRFLCDPAGLMAHGCCPEFVWTHVARGCNTWYI